jgi:hypothetical protein
MPSMQGPLPSPVNPFPGDETPNLRAILAEVKAGCSAYEKDLVHAEELWQWYKGDSEKFIPFRPAEDALSWLTRPKRVSYITRQAVNKLTSHLYKPGPRARVVARHPRVTAWYNQIALDIHLNGVMQQADRLATLHGLCALGIYPTGDARRPINYHLYPRQDFVVWTEVDDPRQAVAVCTITRTGREQIRYRLFTKTHYYTFYKSKNWGYTQGGWNVARYYADQSGPHPYGVLPFVFITHELPTVSLVTHGLGDLLAKINKAANTDQSNLALWVHCYARPLGFVSGVGPEWRPRYVDGGFIPLTVRRDSTEDSSVVPEARYLESNLDIRAVQEYIRATMNDRLAELDIPLTLTVQSDGGKGAMAQSGIAIVAHDADLITYSKGRHPLFEIHEGSVCALSCRIAAPWTPDLRPELMDVALDPTLRVAWPEVAIDLPGQARDQADQFELTIGLTDPIELLMRRQGLTESEAIRAYANVSRRKKIAEALDSDPMADVSGLAPMQGEEGEAAEEIDELMGRAEGTQPGPSDMGIADGRPPTGPEEPEGSPSVSVTVAVDPQYPIPAAPLLLPATPGYGTWGTEE